VPHAAAIREAIAHLATTTTQRPPSISAVHIDGERAYKRARRGDQVVLDERPVTWHSIDVVSIEEAAVHLDVRSGSGAYMRSLARDLGELLGCGGHAASLRRLEVGEWSVDDAVAPDQVTEAMVRDPLAIVSDLPILQLHQDQLRAFCHGQRVPAPAVPDDAAVAVTTPSGTLVGMATCTAGELQPDAVFEAPSAHEVAT
jgi:tRNA pseudouridine55 synthase